MVVRGRLRSDDFEPELLAHQGGGALQGLDRDVCLGVQNAIDLGAAGVHARGEVRLRQARGPQRASARAVTTPQPSEVELVHDCIDQLGPGYRCLRRHSQTRATGRLGGDPGPRLRQPDDARGAGWSKG